MNAKASFNPAEPLGKRPKSKKVVRSLCMSPAAMAERFHRWRKEGYTWAEAADRANSLGLWYKSQRAPWTEAGAMVFYLRRHPSPQRRRYTYRRVSGMPGSPEDCREATRPCPWAACRYHMAEFYIPANHCDTSKAGRPASSVERGNFNPLPYTCLWDVIEEHGAITSGEEIAQILNVSRETVRRMISKALDHAEEIDPVVGAGLRRVYQYTCKMRK